MAVVVAVLLAGAAIAIDRTWFAPPSLAPGARHTATMRVVPHGCPGQEGPQLDFGGRHWWPEATPQFALPATGTLVILRRVGASDTRPPQRTAVFEVGDTSVDLVGGTSRYPVTSCPIS
jgi:hypothetical protein